MYPEREYIPVTVDKSNIITIGERRESAKADTHTLNLARLITQEIALMKDSRNPRQAFERQSRLLKDAFIEKEKID